ncbi:MAG: LA2681 family HEPN domain-containing protein [Oscillospiraceae bacterium]|nr:LA2681 family HEPN domain-containing protein [Oscillospiraceae bacterium]
MADNRGYEDSNLRSLSEQCDNAYDNQNEEEMSKLIDTCYEQAHALNSTGMIKARHFYLAFTTQSNLIALKMRREKINDAYEDRIKALKRFETDYQKSLYLARNAFELLNVEIETGSATSEEEMAYLHGFLCQLHVNYANFFYTVGRFSKAVEILSVFDAEAPFPMGVAQLGMKLYELSRCHYDSSHQKIMLYKAFHYIKQAQDATTPYPEREEMQGILNYYRNSIVPMLGQDYLNKQFTINDFLKPFGEMTDSEACYRKWVANNKLALNLLNDVFDTVEVAYDPLHLPSMVEKIESPKAKYLHGLFNQLKQEYVSARFLAYEGLTQRDTHFSDKKVYLINTLDYPIYGLGIEKIKASYRASYSIFDKIAFFLNEYFELKIKKKIGYVRVFSPELNADDPIKILDIAENNYPLYGMWWLFKDVRNININEDGTVNRKDVYKHIDSAMSKISRVRNDMEHGYLKVLDFFGGEALDDNDRLDQLAHNIGFESFEKLTLQLLNYVREAIILLVFAVKRMEDVKESHRSPNELVSPMLTNEYDDDWKQIF